MHGLLEHLYGCLELCKRRGLPGDRVFVHAFTDGRDTSPNSGLNFVRAIEAKMREIGVGQIATVIGRYWAMDRDNRWPRVEKAYRAIAFGDGAKFRTRRRCDHVVLPNTRRRQHERRRVHHAVGHHLRRRRKTAHDRAKWRLNNFLQLSWRSTARAHQSVRHRRLRWLRSRRASSTFTSRR